MKKHDAFALKDFDETKIFDVDAWVKRGEITAAAQVEVAVGSDRAVVFHKRIVRHLTRLTQLKAAMASKVTRAADSTLPEIKNRISRADKLVAAYEEINRQALVIKQRTNLILDAHAFIERRAAKNIFKSRLYSLRRERKLSQAEMAKQLGIKQSSYSAYEGGRVEPTISVLIKLVKYFNKPADWFLGL